MVELEQLAGIGPKTVLKLKSAHINSGLELLGHFPHRYLDFSHFKPIKDLVELENATISGKIIKFHNIFTRSHKSIQKAVVADNSGQIELMWFNQPYLAKTLIEGTSHRFAGTVSRYQQHLTLIAPITGLYHTGKIIAVYPETSQLKSGWFRKTIQTHLSVLTTDLVDPLPSSVLAQFKLLNLATAYREIHCPTNFSRLNQAIHRLSLNEITSLLATAHLKKTYLQSKTPKNILKTNPQIDQKIDRLITGLPFKLTSSQISAWVEIKKQLLLHLPLNQLLQGDVGSGKTIVALIAAYFAYLNRVSTLIIVPTAILASQHFHTFTKFLPKLNIRLFTATHPLKLTDLPKTSIIIATHAAIYQSKTLAPKIGLLIIDEQHKFGVRQRSFLNSSAHPPHCLTMTATPIPRTISLTLLGHLNLTTLDLSPINRQTVKTFLVPNHKQLKCYQWLAQLINTTHQQAFIVCPFIEESDTLTSVKSAVTEFDKLSSAIFPDLKLGLIHGKTPDKNRQKILDQFALNKINILVTTPIIEVGVDYPNATTIIILSADRFGLAQLHQLRGRIGRSNLPGFCYLFTESDQPTAINRLQFLEKHHHGQEIAEYDLQIRGPGETFSTLQHGFPSLKLAHLSDYELITTGQKIINQLIGLNFDLTLITNHSESHPGFSELI